MTSKTHARKNAPATSCENVFIPICLYSVFFKERANLKAVLDAHGREAAAILIVVCDELHAVNLRIRNKLSSRVAQKRALRQGTELYNMAKRVVAASACAPRVWLTRWREIAAMRGFAELAEQVSAVVATDEQLNSLVAKFVNHNVERLGWTLSAETRGLERSYLCSEITMTVYTCEILGFGTHIWEVAPPTSEPDPIEFLYSVRPDLIAKMIGRESAGRRVLTVR